jgi:hypothetical protein
MFLLIPFALALIALKQGYLPGNSFILFMAIYFFIYRPFICGLRLVKGEKISRHELWKNFIPFWNDKYWVFLFFNK